MKSIKVNGIILRAYPSAEADLVLRVLSKENGKLSLLAKHARKSKRRFGSGLDVFDRGLFTIAQGGTGLFMLNAFEPERSLNKLREDLDKLVAASCLSECFDLLVKEGNGDEEEIYSLFTLAINAVHDASSRREILKASYVGLSQLLQLLGFIDDELAEAPSINNFTKLLTKIENCVEKKLGSKLEIIRLLDTFKKEQEPETSAPEEAAQPKLAHERR